MNIGERVRGAMRRVGEVSLRELAFCEFVCWTRWTADGGSGVEPGPVFLRRVFRAPGCTGNTQSGA